jgi:hypothetical protein
MSLAALAALSTPPSATVPSPFLPRSANDNGGRDKKSNGVQEKLSDGMVVTDRGHDQGAACGGWSSWPKNDL